MEKSDNIIEGKKIEESETEYKPIGTISIKKEKNHSNFGKQVIVPFLSGVVGAGLVVGICFGVPSIRNNIVKTDTGNSSTSSTNTSNGTISAISLENYSDTGISVANKVLPSVVGIDRKSVV